MTSILLIPAPEGRDALLREGPCGARPPIAYQEWHEDYGDRVNGGAWGDEWIAGSDDDYPHEEGHMALVLAWEGVICVEGCDRALRVLGVREGLDGRHGYHWRPWRLDYDEPIAAWCLEGWGDSNKRAYWLSEESGAPAPFVIPGLATLTGDDVPTWSLATVCAARGLGTVVTLGADHE